MTQKSGLFFLLLLFSPLLLEAQPETYPLHWQYTYQLEPGLYQTDSIVHTSARPYNTSQVSGVKTAPQPLSVAGDTASRTFSGTVLWRLTNDHLIQVDEDIFSLRVNPVMMFHGGREMNEDQWVTRNTRGFQLSGKLGDKFYFYSDFFETQSLLSPYMKQFADSIHVMPGQGITRDFKTQGVDYSFANGHIAYKPADFFTLQAGHGRNFFGDGYRSLMLSDFAPAYPYVKFTTKVWKFQYTNLYTQFSHYQDRTASSLVGDGYPQKGGSFHYLSTRIGKRFDLGLFEGVVWQRQDTMGNYRGFDMNYYNPVIFYRPIEFSMGSPDNMIMGLNTSYIIADGIRAYGQLVLTDFNFEQFKQRNQHIVQKVAFQLGVVERFTVGQTKVRLQQEWNQARPFMYAHKDPRQNFTHLNQTLAHPLGANFVELVLNATAFVGDKWVFRYHGTFAQAGLDTDSTYHGNNIYRAERDVQTIVGHGLLDGLKTTILNQTVGAYYMINPHSRLQAGAELIYRNFVNSQRSNQNMVLQLKLTTSLYNFYQDF